MRRMTHNSNIMTSNRDGWHKQSTSWSELGCPLNSMSFSMKSKWYVKYLIDCSKYYAWVIAEFTGLSVVLRLTKKGLEILSLKTIIFLEFVCSSPLKLKSGSLPTADHHGCVLTQCSNPCHVSNANIFCFRLSKHWRPATPVVLAEFKILNGMFLASAASYSIINHCSMML